MKPATPLSELKSSKMSSMYGKRECALRFMTKKMRLIYNVEPKLLLRRLLISSLLEVNVAGVDTWTERSIITILFEWPILNED